MTNPDLAALSAAATQATAAFSIVSSVSNATAMVNASEDFRAALVDAYRTGNLVQIDREGMRERVIIAMLQSEPHLECRADAAIAAILGGEGHG